MFTYRFEFLQNLSHDQVIMWQTVGIIASIILVWKLVLKPFWIPAVAVWFRTLFVSLGAGIARTFKQLRNIGKRKTTHRPSATLSPGADSPQPDTTAKNSALVPAAGDVHAEKQSEAPETHVAPSPVTPQQPVAANGSTWNERLLKVPAQFCPATDEDFYALVLYNSSTNSFTAPPTLRFYGTAQTWARVYRNGSVPAFIESDEESQKIKAVSGKHAPSILIRGARYPLDRNYQPAPATPDAATAAE